jgi:2'-5' RNA ligase
VPFRVGRFVLMSSRDSIGGGPYVIEEAWPLSGAEPGRGQAAAGVAHEMPRYIR